MFEKLIFLDCFLFLFMISATVGSDPADITYLYESPPGYVLLGLRLYALIWFVRAILITRLKYARKRGFYRKFGVAGCLWLIALPFQVGLASQVVQIHQRPRFVYAFNVVVNMLFFSGMLLIFAPSRFNRAFPFHAKTSDMEARPPSSTTSAMSGGGRGGSGGGSGSSGGGRPRNGAQQQTGGSVEMTSNGPIFRNRSAGGGGGGGGGGGASSRRSAGASSAMSGGLSMGTPEDRVRFSIQKIRNKITQLVDHSDDLEFALDEMNLHDWDSPNVKDADYELPNAHDDEGGHSGPSSGFERGLTNHNNGNNNLSSSAAAAAAAASSNGNKKKNKKKGPRPPPMMD